MKSQTLVAIAAVLGGLTMMISTVQAQTTQRYYSNARTTYTYRPAATAARPAAPVAAKPATTAARPATAAAATTTPAAKPGTTTVSANKPVQQSFHPTILGMLARNNSIRASRGMRPMFLSGRLTAAAQSHANYMARTGGFSHYSNGGPQGRAAAYGFRGGVRENIAMGQPSVDSAFAVWTASGGHYANMMSHSDVAGFGYAVGASGQPYWVAVYGNNDGGN